MTDSERLKKASERAEKRAKEILKPAPGDIEEELKNETIMGSSENLVRPYNKDE